MLKIFLLVAIATVDCSELKDKLNRDPVAKVLHLSTPQGNRLHGFHPRSDWSWMPSVPNFFKFEDDEEVSPEILKRLEAVERMLKELNDRMKKESNTGEEGNARLFREDEDLTNHRQSGPKKSESSTTPSTPCKETASMTSKPIQQDEASNDQKPQTMTKPAEQPTPTKNSEISESISTPETPAETTEAKQDENSTQDSLPAGKEAMANPKENSQLNKGE